MTRCMHAWLPRLSAAQLSRLSPHRCPVGTSMKLDVAFQDAGRTSSRRAARSFRGGEWTALLPQRTRYHLFDTVRCADARRVLV